MNTTTHNAAPGAVQAEPCQKCRDNFPLPMPCDVFDQKVVQGYIVRRTACTARPATDKPCMQGVAASVRHEQDDAPQYVAASFWQGRAEFGPSRFAAQAALLDACACQTEHGPAVLLTVHGARLANVEIALAPEAAQAFVERLAHAIAALADPKVME